MPGRVVPKWGWTGMVRLERYARLEDAVGELDSHSEPAGDQRQALHRRLTGAQCDDLMTDLDLPLLDGDRAECHDWLNWIRETVLTDCLRRAQQPTRPEIHEALNHIGQHIRDFLSGSGHVDFEWVAADSSTEAAGPLTVFWLFPRRLQDLADKARHTGNTELVVLVEGAALDGDKRQGHRDRWL